MLSNETDLLCAVCCVFSAAVPTHFVFVVLVLRLVGPVLVLVLLFPFFLLDVDVLPLDVDQVQGGLESLWVVGLLIQRALRRRLAATLHTRARHGACVRIAPVRATVSQSVGRSVVVTLLTPGSSERDIRNFSGATGFVTLVDLFCYLLLSPNESL